MCASAQINAARSCKLYFCLYFTKPVRQCYSPLYGPHLMLSLIVALTSPTPADEEFSYVLSRDASARSERQDDELTSAVMEHGLAVAASLPMADELVLVVPTRRLSWHLVRLPRVSRARLRNVLEGLLEERLLEDPQSLHFALAPNTLSSGMVWVAACRKAWLYPALQTFETIGRPVARVVPEHVPALEGAEPSLHAIGIPEAAWLVRCADDGVQAVPLGLAALTTLEVAAAAGPATAEPAVAAMAEEILRHSVRVTSHAHGLVFAARSRWNLAQLELTSTSGSRTARRITQAWAQGAGSKAWKPARWGLAALLLTQLVGLNAWAWKERTALDAKRAEARALLIQTFPRIPLVVNAPLQMEREVALLRQATGALSRRDLEPMLAAVAENAQVARPPAGIDFVAGELTLKGFEMPASAATSLIKGLALAGYRGQASGDQWVIRPADTGTPAISTNPLTTQ